jgi:hypothetical protein
MVFPEVQPVIVASHPRSGTHLLMDLLRRQFAACRSWKWPGERLDRLYCSIDELNAERNRLDDATARRILRRTDRPLVKTHAWPRFQDTFLVPHHDGLDPEWLTWFHENGTILYVYRDGRDVMCSYQMMRHRMDASLPDPIGAFMRGHDPGQNVNRVRRWAQHVCSWRAMEETHVLSFEDLLHTPEDTIEQLGHMLGCSPEWREPLLPERFSSIWESRWARLFHLRPESTAILGTGAKEWEDVFTSEDRAFFHECAGDLLIELGYVDSDEWVHAPEAASADTSTQDAS